MIRETEKALRNNNNPLPSIQPLMADIGRERMVRVTYNHENRVLYRASTYNTQILNALLFLMVIATRLLQYIYYIFICSLTN